MRSRAKSEGFNFWVILYGELIPIVKKCARTHASLHLIYDTWLTTENCRKSRFSIEFFLFLFRSYFTATRVYNSHIIPPPFLKLVFIFFPVEHRELFTPLILPARFCWRAFLYQLCAFLSICLKIIFNISGSVSFRTHGSVFKKSNTRILYF